MISPDPHFDVLFCKSHLHHDLHRSIIVNINVCDQKQFTILNTSFTALDLINQFNLFDRFVLSFSFNYSTYNV